MPSPVTVTEIDGVINGRDCRTQVWQTTAGFQGRRWFRITTSDAVNAMLVGGLPAIGDPFSLAIPDCTAQQIGPVEPLGGAPDGGGNAGGLCICPVEYGTTPPSILPQPTSPSEKWTVINVDADTVQARFALQVNQLNSDGSLGAWLDPADSKLFPIAEGDGASKSIGRIRLSVFRHFTKTTTLDYARLFDLSTAHALNNASVTLPPLYRGSQNLIFAQGQLMYTGFAARLVGNILQVEHSLDAASDFYARWAVIDAKGKQVDAYAGRLHEFKDFADLF